MRRILRKISADEIEGIGDTSTLADPAVVDHIIEKGLYSNSGLKLKKNFCT